MQNLIRNKRGVAEVVATVSLVLLTTVAAIILAGEMKGFVNKERLAPEFNCLDYQTSQTFSIIKACYDVGLGDVLIDVQRKINSIDILELDFTINTESGGESFSCGLDCGNCEVQGIGEKKKYYLSVNNFEEGKVVLHVAGCRLAEAEITGRC
ncbi:hypothetical protein J4462_03900 [Candidatus Pacearchaeota archaeon]|nr:hypothetical protein [Candidatus Pacearchaeota archaeon]